jgi:hypothetical protein
MWFAWVQDQDISISIWMDDEPGFQAGLATPNRSQEDLQDHDLQRVHETDGFQARFRCVPRGRGFTVREKG